MNDVATMEKIVSLCKRRGLIFPASEGADKHDAKQKDKKDSKSSDSSSSSSSAKSD